MNSPHLCIALRVCVEVLMHEADSVRATDWTTDELGFDPL